MNREKRKRQLATKCQLERLEIRWLMKLSLTATVSAAPDAEVRQLSTHVEHWLNHHALAALPLDVKHEKAALVQVLPSNLGNWGALRVLARLEAQGDHRFDLVYQRISAHLNIGQGCIPVRRESPACLRHRPLRPRSLHKPPVCPAHGPLRHREAASGRSPADCPRYSGTRRLTASSRWPRATARTQITCCHKTVAGQETRTAGAGRRAAVRLAEAAAQDRAAEVQGKRRN